MANEMIRPDEIREAVEAVKMMAENVDALRAKFVAGATDVARRVTDMDQKFDRAASKGRAIVKTAVDLNRELRSSGPILTDLDRYLSQVSKTFDTMGLHFTKLDARIASIKRGIRDAYVEGGVLTDTTKQRFLGNDVLGLTGNQGVGAFLARQASSLTSVLPAGGLLGLFLHGVGGEETWRARAFEAARTFDAVAQTSQATIDRVNARGQNLARTWGVDVPTAIRELVPTFSALAKVGISGEGAGLATMMPGANVADMGVALDTYFKAGSGQFGDLIAQEFATTGRAADSAANSVYKVARALEGTGVNTVATMGSLMSMTSTMKIQRQSVEDLTAVYERLRDVNQRERGGSTEANSQLALRGMAGIAGGLANLPEGYASVLGRQLNPNMDPLAAAYMMRDGLNTRDGKNFSTNLRQILNDAQTRIGGDESRIRKFLESTLGFGLEGSGQAVKLMRDRDFMSGRTDVSGKALLDFQTASERRADETGKYERAMLNLQQDIVKIGALTLKVMVDGFRTLVDLPDLFSTNAATRERAGQRAMKRIKSVDELGRSLANFGSDTLKPFSGLMDDVADPSSTPHTDEVYRALVAQRSREFNQRGVEDSIKQLIERQLSQGVTDTGKIKQALRGQQVSGPWGQMYEVVDDEGTAFGIKVEIVPVSKSPSGSKAPATRGN
jgi:hypothetical protein